jgi:ATP-dependent Clp protease ATP-binding subunit ClpA
VFERFTADARRVVMAARDEASLLGHDYVGTEHLLLAMLAWSTGPAARVLTDGGLNPELVRTEVIRLAGSSSTLGAGEAEALQAIGIDLDAVRSKLEHSFGEGVLDIPVDDPGRPPFRGGIRFTRRAKKVLELALREARALRHNYIGDEHILLGLIRERDGMAGEILAATQPLQTWRQRLVAELDKAA